ncbi:MAG: DMT family transporter [Alphaproteobacteria bacterium]|nr:DMT family transporter [Alphaproteobacteria bacterium]
MSKSKTIQNNILGIVITIATAIAFGAYPPTVRAVYADGGNAVFILLVTTFARALALYLFCILFHKPLFKTKEDTKIVIIGGFLQALGIFGIFSALTYLPGAVVIIIVFTHTLMLLFFMAWRREIKITLHTLAVTLAALGGLSLVLNIWHQEQHLSYVGMSLAFIAAIAITFRVYIYGHLTKTRNPAVVGAEVFLIATVFAMLSMFFEMPQPPASFEGYGWLSLGCLSLILGTFGVFYGISLIGSFNFSLLSKLEPVFTAIFSIILINEFLSWHQYAGILVVITSLIIYQYMDYRKRSK